MQKNKIDNNFMQLVGPKVFQNFHVQQTLGWTCFSYKDIIECLLFRHKGHEKKS
jgi:hypothetical protein